jgi:hypothetical protein
MIAFLAGCSSVRVIGFPGLENIPDGPQGEEMEPLKTGMDIKINLKTGESIEGRVVQFDLESVTIGNPSNYGTKASVVAFEEVESMTAEWGPYVSPFAILAGAVVGVVLTLYISLRMNLQSMN